MDKLEILLAIYDDNREYARHHENQRSTASNITMVISAGILGLLTFDQSLDLYDLPMSIFLTLLGAFGASFSAKHYERVRLHLYRAEEYFRKIEALVPETELEALRLEANRRTKERFPMLYGFKLNLFWIILHLFLSLVGAALSIVIVKDWISLGA